MNRRLLRQFTVGILVLAPVDSDGTAPDVMLEIPAVGRNGSAPLQGFLKQ